jgi:subtilisin family serine protease
MGPPENFAPGTIYRSPRDDFGHGTHTASTAVGSEVNLANVRKWDSHTAKGGAPRARLAVYKACWHNWCSCADILKAYDDAIHDGVDIITISIGPYDPDPAKGYLEDCFLVGSLIAFRNGILVSASAGNAGNDGSGNVVNAAPWILTVAASTIDRESFCYVRLGDSSRQLIQVTLKFCLFRQKIYIFWFWKKWFLS